MKRFALLIALVAGIPVGGYLSGVYVENDFQKQWANLVAKKLGDKGIAALDTGQLTLVPCNTYTFG